MDCPYFDCDGKGLDPEPAACRVCQRPFEACGKCRHPNRSFAVFCGACGEPLVAGEFDWSGYRGGPRRLGMNPCQVGRSWMKSELVAVDHGRIDLDEACFDLLSWNRHLIAIGRSGRVEIRAPGAMSPGYSLQLDGPPSCHACIERSTLFVGCQGSVAAYGLGALTLPEPRTTPRWTVPVPGEPVGSLLVVENRLFLNVARGNEVGVVVLDHVFTTRPPTVRWLHEPASTSPVAGDRNTGKAYFLSERSSRISIHTVHAGIEDSPVEAFVVPDMPSSQLNRSSLAVMGKNLFVVLGEDDDLYRMQPGKPTVRLATDIRRFGLNSFDQRVHLRTTDLLFPHGQEVELGPMERINGEPVILRNFALAVGLQDGRITIYDLNNPPFCRHERLDGHAITSLASFGPYLAAGTARGTVALYQVVPA